MDKYYSLLLPDKPISFNRDFVKLGIGIKGALFLSQAVYWSKRTKNPNGEFYKTREEWEEETGMTAGEQREAIKRLKAKGYIVVEKKGIPAKNYYTVISNKIIKDLYGLNILVNDKSSRNLTTGDKETLPLVVKKPYDRTSGNLTTNTENTTEITTKTTTKKILLENPEKSEFSPPTLSEWKDYFLSTVNEKIKSFNRDKANIEAELSYNFYDMRDWKVKTGNKLQKMKDWKRACLQWVLRSFDKLYEKRKNSKAFYDADYDADSWDREF